MATTDFLGRGIGFPLGFDDGALREAADEESVRQSVLLILETAPGERVMRPEFGCGIHNLVFANIMPSTATEIRRSVQTALTRFEPRIDVDAVRVRPAPDQENRLDIEIEYTVRAINRKENLVYPFYLQG